MIIEACIFDLDGVIVDTARFHYQSWKKVAEGLGIPFSERDNEKLKGISRMASLDIILSMGGIQMDQAEKEALADEKNSGYLDYVRSLTPSQVLPGVRSLLQELERSGIQIALGSSSKNAELILEKAGLDGLFEAVVDGNSPLPAKPDPGIFLGAAAALGADPASTVVFEDSPAGIEAARAGGFRSVGLGSKEWLGRADIVLPGLEGITLEKISNLLDQNEKIR